MEQLHKRFTDEQVKVLLAGYCRGTLSRVEVQDMLQIGRAQFFSLLREYRRDPQSFSLAYQRATLARLSAEIETAIEQELLREKALVEDPRLPISNYNYTALRDRISKQGLQVSVTTIIERAKRLGCYRAQKPRKVHDREVLTAATGALIQHDASLHL